MSKPGFFGDIGKKASGTLEDDYKYDCKFDLKSKASNGVTFQSTITRNGASQGILGALKSTWKCCNWAKMEGTLDTAGKVEGTVDMENFAPNSKVSVQGGVSGKFKGSAEYKHEYVTLQGAVETAGDAGNFTNLSGSVVVGHNGFSIGVDAKQVVEKDKSGKESQVFKKDGAAQYDGGDFIASIHCTKKANLMIARYAHMFKNGNLVAAGEVQYDRVKRADKEKQQHKFTVGVSNKIDSDTSVRAKLDSEGLASVVYIQRLRPEVTAKLSGQIDTTKLSGNCHKVGLALCAEL
mmetsp:Transcript_33976/g.77642  ORF Transcript_33976/g.77642 Transcript_33976/m.77642 type:complete len:293 (-) Transcript_33976:69-947(-)|eukprot:CAMPEP_0114554314 /NCGR_PEP_ID=MMETSP0114-20121206/8146_1 /TAXON_ID=31324 /ORGANISM="Goniomonas sp, Strain m" /LENGTH=292 /DNA_ID=CAMNT_0001739357 /DNA_START=13 /DNA_END=891 /DNA_ORIENTATION=+